MERWPWKAWDVTLDDHDVIHPIGRLGRQTGKYWHVWHDGGALSGLTFCSKMLHLPQNGLTSPLEGLDASFQLD
jgi:hypothetical protein